jgi:hypothetical protein
VLLDLFVAAMVAWVRPEPAAYLQFSGLLHFEPAARVGQKTPRAPAGSAGPVR